MTDNTPPDGKQQNFRSDLQKGFQSITSELRDKDARQKRKEQLKKGVQSLGDKLQKINLAKLIDNMEKDQDLAYQLEEINEHLRQDKEFRDLKREATEACMKEVREHLDEFLEREGPESTYEQWIEELHPENAHEGKLLDGLDKEIDLRFYVEESDHRQLWNERAPPNRQVAARNRMFMEDAPPPQVDLLDTPDDRPSTASNDTAEEADLISFD